MWSRKWKHNKAISTEALIVLDLAEIVDMNIRNENEGVLKTHMDCKVAWELLTDDMLKDNQFAMDRGSIISKILEIERESRVQFEYTHAKTKKQVEEDINGKGTLMVIKCDNKSKEEMIKREEQHKNEIMGVLGNIILQHRHRVHERRVSKVIKQQIS